jgi:ribonuclease E
VAEVTSLGLVQMTRKRVGSGLLEAFSEPCECCNGRGLIVSLDLIEHNGGGHRGRGGKDSRPGRPGREDTNGKPGKDKSRKSGKNSKPGKDGGPAKDAEPGKDDGPGKDSKQPGIVAEDGNGLSAPAATAATGAGAGRRRAATRRQGPPEMFAPPGSALPGSQPAGPGESGETTADAGATTKPEPGEAAAG